MEEHDDWKLGDEGEVPACPRCGKRNRAGLTYCVICGSPLADDLAPDPDALRTLGEAMGGKRPPARRAAPRHSLRAWSIAAAVLLAIVVVLTWLQTREDPFRLEDLLAPPPVAATPTPEPVATTIATRAVAPTRRPVAPSPAPPVVVPPVPTAAPVTAPPLPRPDPTARIVPPPRPVVVPPPRPVVAPTVVRAVPTPQRVPATETVAVATPDERPRIEATAKPSLGTDLQDATRAYRAAVDVHNARVDEYNALADEIQRRNAWDDSESSVELRRRLDRAREAIESARVQAESLRARMEGVRALYR